MEQTYFPGSRQRSVGGQGDAGAEFPRQLAAWVTDNMSFSVSESTAYRILRREGLMKRPEMRLAAGKEYHRKTLQVPTRFGPQTPPTSGWWAGATTTWSPSWTTTPVSYWLTGFSGI